MRDKIQKQYRGEYTQGVKTTMRYYATIVKEKRLAYIYIYIFSMYIQSRYRVFFLRILLAVPCALFAENFALGQDPYKHKYVSVHTSASRYTAFEKVALYEDQARQLQVHCKRARSVTFVIASFDCKFLTSTKRGKNELNFVQLM